jgi:guanosine-3',5'-bis(diphosphate) 3'-pyrophosphohydrolase
MGPEKLKEPFAKTEANSPVQTNALREDIEKIAHHAYQSFKEKYLSYLDPVSESILYKAFKFAHNLHAGQRRKSGEPYIIHPLAVAEILADFKIDETSLVAALLHDVVEDTHVSVGEVSREFGEPVATLVEGLTKLAKVQFRSSQEKMAENFRKMIVAMSRDIRVIIVKLADRTHNMRTLRALSLEKRQRIAEETIEIYAPIAGRLGMYKIKAELEDLCLRELKPSVYYSLIARVAQKKTQRDSIIETAREHLSLKLKEANIPATVYGRAKHFYSIYRKMSDKQIEFEDIYDLFALRVVVETSNECYESLGIIHNIYKPVPGRFKDFIAMPKANLYQSLHTTLIAEQGELLEVQIRTVQMHHIAENGIAAHWAYKERKKDSSGEQLNPADFKKFKWLKQIVNHQKELSDPDEFLEAVKVDLFDEEVYVFSPKGDVFELRKGATCLDFAFAIHTDLGLRTTGAKINGRIATLRTRLHSGDVIELLVGNKVRATKDWLNFTTTIKAKNKIRGWLRTEERAHAKQLGQEMLEEELLKQSSSFEKFQKSGVFQEINKYFSVGGYEDFILQLGYGKLELKNSVQKLLAILNPSRHQESAQDQHKNLALPEVTEFKIPKEALKSREDKNSFLKQNTKDAVCVQQMTDIVVRMARCCEPLPGQPLVGFVSRSRGVTVHAANCPWALSNDPARRVDCSWNAVPSLSQSVRVRITAHDKPGMLAAITKVVSTSHINIESMECFTNPQKRAVILLKLQLADIHQLKDIHQKIEAVDGIIHVERTMG